MSPETKLILFEAVLIVGAAFGFGFWQLRSVKRDQEKTKRERAQRDTAESVKND